MVNFPSQWLFKKCRDWYTVPYTILNTDAKSDIDKYTVYLTEHSTVNIPQSELSPV